MAWGCASEVAALAHELRGADGVEAQKIKHELKQVNREINSLKRKLSALEKRKKALLEKQILHAEVVQ